MCTAHPYNHACGHNSVQWNFCPRSTINFQNGLTTPCDNQHSARPMDTEDSCPIYICRWHDKGGVWTCCQCGNQPNHLGWCVFERPRLEQNAITGEWENVRHCNHTCCDYCTAYVDRTSAMNPSPFAWVLVTGDEKTMKNQRLTAAF